MANDRLIVASWQANKRKANIFSSIGAKGGWKIKEAKMSCNVNRGRVTLIWIIEIERLESPKREEYPHKKKKKNRH